MEISADKTLAEAQQEQTTQLIMVSSNVQDITSFSILQ